MQEDRDRRKQWLSTHCEKIESHRAFLQRFDGWRLQRWEQLLAQQPESAIVDACVRDLLARQTDSLEPFEGPSEGGPDYVCRNADEHFYAEVTCLEEGRVTRLTSLTPSLPSPHGAQSYSDLTRAILNECVTKARQLQNLDSPCLLFIGTLHPQASQVCFQEVQLNDLLTGSEHMERDFDPGKGEAVGPTRVATDLSNAPFLRFTAQGVEGARKTISGIVCCGFGWYPPEIRGVLHPEAVRPFNRCLLPNIPLGRLVQSYNALRVVWE